MNYINEYWDLIKNKKILVSKKVYIQYKKLAKDIRHHKDFYFSEQHAMKAIKFIERFCKHSKGEWAGQTVKLELFQKAYISALFGFLDKETNLRRYGESLFCVARKNGKSTMLSAISLYMLIADNEPGSEVYSTATKFDQASLIFEEVQNMIGLMSLPNTSDVSGILPLLGMAVSSVVCAGLRRKNK